jgi:hypothetical protein
MLNSVFKFFSDIFKQCENQKDEKEAQVEKVNERETINNKEGLIEKEKDSINELGNNLCENKLPFEIKRKLSILHPDSIEKSSNSDEYKDLPKLIYCNDEKGSPEYKLDVIHTNSELHNIIAEPKSEGSDQNLYKLKSMCDYISSPESDINVEHDEQIFDILTQDSTPVAEEVNANPIQQERH